MTLIYAYIQKYKNYAEQSILFNTEYNVQFQEGLLSFSYAGTSAARSLLRGERKEDHLHFLVGKTGSGKTNLLQLIGMKHEIRYRRKWDGEDDAYFLLYRIDDTQYYLEICDIDMKQFPAPGYPEDKTMPDSVRKRDERTRRLYTSRFSIQGPLCEGTTYQEFIRNNQHDILETAMVLNSYDFNAFLVPPYPDEKEDYQDFRNRAWMGRMVQPYHRTSLWHICDYIRDYIGRIEPGSGKRRVAFVLSTHNFAEQYPLKLENAVERDYWTFYQIKQDEMLGEFDEDARKRAQKRRKKQELSNKQMFIHDLWADYAHYLRKWVEKILLYNAEEEIPKDHLDASGTVDVYQEAIDYYTEKEYKEDIDPSNLPDGKAMTIVKRCTWLAEFIDRADTGDPHGVLWQVIDDIKDIGTILSKLDDKYFTIDTCTIPVVDMEQEKYQPLFFDLFERLEDYHQDDAGIFTEKLLPYSFTCLSTGEYQYAKVLGGLQDCLILALTDKDRKKTELSKIILLDEPETYMHPELARRFVSELHRITAKYPEAPPVQIIIGTHSPFMLSDALPEEVIRLDIDRETGNAIVMPGTEKNYFGANIHTILADGFFLRYTIGEDSRIFLQQAFNDLREAEDHADAPGKKTQQIIRRARELLPYIGDQFIRQAFENVLVVFEGNGGQ